MGLEKQLGGRIFDIGDIDKLVEIASKKLANQTADNELISDDIRHCYCNPVITVMGYIG